MWENIFWEKYSCTILRLLVWVCFWGFFQNERTYHENHFISRILKLNIENDINIYICIKMSLVHKAYIYYDGETHLILIKKRLNCWIWNAFFQHFIPFSDFFFKMSIIIGNVCHWSMQYDQREAIQDHLKHTLILLSVPSVLWYILFYWVFFS